MTDKEYRRGSDAVRAAWFEYKKSNPNDKLSVVSFVAGWNAAMAEVKKVVDLSFVYR